MFPGVLKIFADHQYFIFVVSSLLVFSLYYLSLTKNLKNFLIPTSITCESSSIIKLVSEHCPFSTST